MQTLPHIPFALFTAALASVPLQAMTITGYSSTVHDRFSSGYPTTPIENSDASFVGAGLDWSGVGWASTGATKSFGFLSPQHYLVASHFGGAATITLNGDGGLVSGIQASVLNTQQGMILSGVKDTSIGTLTSPLAPSAGISRYAVLDLNTSSTTNSPGNYTGLSVLIYGRGPNSTSSTRIGQTTIQSTQISNTGTGTWIRTTRDDVQLEGGDSGSPAFNAWVNPAGNAELTLLGLNSAIDTTNGHNYMSFVGDAATMNALNTSMVTSGFALRVVGDPTNTWVGSSSTSIATKGAWGLGPGPSQAPSDKFVTFDAATAGNGGAVTVDTDHDLRGLYFLSTAASGDGFAFGGTNTLITGRGGVTNYDNSRQVFNANLSLGDSQYWDGGSGGVTLNTLNTNGKLLEITGTGLNRITGTVSGSGALAVSGGTLELTGANTYTGKTWVHQPRIRS